MSEKEALEQQIQRSVTATAITKLQRKRDEAYTAWRNGVKQSLKGIVKNIRNEDDIQEFGGTIGKLKEYGWGVDCFVDKVTYNETHSVLKFHITECDGEEKDEWIEEYELVNADSLLENIVW